MDTVLAIDIGNTSTSAGYCRNGRVLRAGRCPTRFRDGAAALELLARRRADAVVVASVVPAAEARWRRLLKRAGQPEPLFVNHRLELGVAIDYPDPASIGADRLANAAAAARLFGAPSVVCDFGTALTFDVLDAGRGYIGGVICPGLPLMFDYLAEKTALLPRIAPSRTRAVVGRSTRQAMQAGARLGYRGMVREILRALEAELGGPPAVCCTGGYAGWIFRGWDVPAVIDPLLTLKGLGVIGELNA